MTSVKDKTNFTAPPQSYVSAWLDPYYSADRYDKAMKPKVEIIVRNLNRPNEEQACNPDMLNCLRYVFFWLTLILNFHLATTSLPPTTTFIS